MDIQKEGELFEHWWEDEGQYHRAGGNEYCKTFAWESWIAAKAQAVPEGYVLVPKEPSQPMIKAGCIEGGTAWSKDIYKVMIAAAQEQENGSI